MSPEAKRQKTDEAEAEDEEVEEERQPLGI